VFVVRVGREEGVRHVLREGVCRVWRERVRVEVGVVLDWKGPVGEEGGPAGRPSRPPSRTTPGGVQK